MPRLTLAPGPEQSSAAQPADADEVNGLTLRIIDFATDEAQTLIVWEVVGREDEGDNASSGSAPSLVDATGKTHRGLYGGAVPGNDRRRGRIVFPAIEPVAGRITLVFDGIRVGRVTGPGTATSTTYEGVWRAEHAWDGIREKTGQKIALATQAQPFGIGSIQIDAVSHVLEGTMIHGHFRGICSGGDPEHGLSGYDTSDCR